MHCLSIPLVAMLLPGVGFGLGCLEHLVLPQYPPLMRGARVSAEIKCTATITPEGPPPRFRCIAISTKPYFSRVAEWVEREAKVAPDCPMTEASFRLRFVIGADMKQDRERYVIDREGVVISIGPLEVQE
jgi:hypothetical protein